MNLLARRSAPDRAEALPAGDVALRAELDAQRGRIAGCAAALEERRAALERAERDEAEGRRALARRAARGELDGPEHEEAAAELRGAPARAADAVALAEEALNAAYEAAREVAAEYEAALLALHDAEISGADAEAAAAEQALTRAQARAADARRRREDAADALAELRAEFDPSLRSTLATLRRQENERIRWLARQPRSRVDLDGMLARDREALEREWARLDAEEEAHRARTREAATRSWEELGTLAGSRPAFLDENE